MNLEINGKAREVSGEIRSVSDLISGLFDNRKGIVVEVNGKLVPRNRGKDTLLKEGDRVEIIQFMGGG